MDKPIKVFCALNKPKIETFFAKCLEDNNTYIPYQISPCDNSCACPQCEKCVKFVISSITQNPQQILESAYNPLNPE